MRIVRPTGALVATASVLALAACTPIVAVGPVTSEERDIEAVTTIVLDSSGDLVVSEGEPALVIHAPEDALARLTSDVEGDTLVLGTTPGTGLVLGDVRYELTLPDLEAIELNGSGDIDATVSSGGTIRLDIVGSGDVEWTDVDSDRIEILISGAGNVELTGETTALAIAVNGSGNVDAVDLRAQTAVVSITGAGNIDVAARESLSVDIAGSGNVTYSGNPAVETEISGSGEVVRE